MITLFESQSNSIGYRYVQVILGYDLAEIMSILTLILNLDYKNYKLTIFFCP